MTTRDYTSVTGIQTETERIRRIDDVDTDVANDLRRQLYEGVLREIAGKRRGAANLAAAALELDVRPGETT